MDADSPGAVPGKYEFRIRRKKIMLSINMDDVMQVVSNIQNYLIAFGVVLVLALLVMFAVRKMPKAKKKMIRAQSGLAILLALAAVYSLQGLL